MNANLDEDGLVPSWQCLFRPRAESTAVRNDWLDPASSLSYIHSIDESYQSTKGIYSVEVRILLAFRGNYLGKVRLSSPGCLNNSDRDGRVSNSNSRYDIDCSNSIWAPIVMAVDPDTV